MLNVKFEQRWHLTKRPSFCIDSDSIGFGSNEQPSLYATANRVHMAPRP